MADSSKIFLKYVAWPLVAALALFLFRNEIADEIPNMTKVHIGSLLIEKRSPLGQQASDEIIESLDGLTESSIFNLISRSLSVTCFVPPVDGGTVRNDHAQLIQIGLIEEIEAVDLSSACAGFDNPTIGLRRTNLGEQVRSFQLSVLEDLSSK